jgi:glutathione synthase/RimK-type ligase-like ATP-grasp enzyme
MRVGIHLEPLGQFGERLLKFEEILLHNNIEVLRLNSDDSDFWEQIKTLDLFIYNFAQYDHDMQKALTILPIIEFEYKIDCFPNFTTCWHFDNKIRQFYLMKAHGFPLIDSYIFHEKTSALDWASKCKLPLVFKLKGGAGSKNVILIEKRKQLFTTINEAFSKGFADTNVFGSSSLKTSIIERIKRSVYIRLQKFKNKEIPFRYAISNWNKHKNYVLFQKFLPENSFDTRVTTIGNKAFSFRRHNRKDDFRSSGSGLIDYNKDEIDINCIKLAFKISKEMQFQTMAYDFLYNEDGDIEFCEISYNYVDKAVWACQGYWDENFEWHKGHFWPQYILLKYLLNIDDFKQPE